MTMLALLLGTVSLWLAVWARWKQMRLPELPSLGEYEPTLRLLPRGSIQRKREIDR